MWSVARRVLPALSLLALSSCAHRTRQVDLTETKELTALHQAARSALQRGAVDEAASLFTRAYAVAADAHLNALAGRYLGNLGALAFLQKAYRTACARLLQAKQMSEQAADAAGAAMELANLSTIYIQTGDIPAAGSAAEQALAQIGGGPGAVPPGTREQVLCNLGTILARQGDFVRAEQAFGSAIDSAAASGQTAILGQAWDSLGYERLKRGALPDAERDLLEAYRIQMLRKDPSLAATLTHLSELRQKQGDLHAAAQLISSALRGSGGGIPLWYLYFRRASILSAQRKPEEALASYRKAVEAARAWREEIAPSDTLRSSTADWLSELYGPFIDQLMEGWQERQPGSRRAIEAFAVLEEYRAAALRRTLSDSTAWRKNLPDEYWQTLNQLRSTEARLLTADGAAHRALEKLEARMDEIEAREYTQRVGDSPTTVGENLLPRKTLSNIQRRLSSRELLLSFRFGEQISYVWAVAHERAEVHCLGATGPLKEEARRFERALESASSDSERLGRRLYGELLGRLSTVLQAKQEWIFATDDTTVRIPWIALREPARRGDEFVVESHSVRFVPSALSFLGRGERTSAQAGVKGFLGVGDGVYNRADPREINSGGDEFDARAAVQLPRLVGSGQELSRCARMWPGEARLLTGKQLSRAALIQELARRPSVIHIAAHVLETAGPGESVIHLGFGAGGVPEILTRFDVANLNLPGSTVVMSGCASAAAPAPAGVGLLGLARAWLIAGAGSVVGSRWSAPDDGSGGLFERFYRYLPRGSGGSAGVAGALREAELDMLHSGSWRARPRYWASFIDVGKE